MQLTTTEERLTRRARRIAALCGRRRLGLADGYSGSIRVVRGPAGARTAYVVHTTDGGIGLVLGGTGAKAAAALSAQAEEASA